tara:strand:+ start:150 stop:326 length:177 start_codon:yes stop_codon:yes gene_type:complete
MKVIMYGYTEPKYPVYISKKTKNYSFGSGRQFVMLSDKQFDKKAKKFQKELQKRKNKK